MPWAKPKQVATQIEGLEVGELGETSGMAVSWLPLRLSSTLPRRRASSIRSSGVMI